MSAGLAQRVSNLLASLKPLAYSPPLPIEINRIHVANSAYFMDGQFSPEKDFCNNRLTVAYRPDTPSPERWLRFLSELLYPEGILILQEYLDYCPFPATRGQKMLALIGRGGEGKSRIGLVMHSIFGDRMNTTSIQKVEKNRFSRADLQNKLLIVDNEKDKPTKRADDPFLSDKLIVEREGIFLWRLKGLNHLLRAYLESFKE